MPRLRITFEVDERHVGTCLVLLEGRAKNLGFEVIEEVAFNKNQPAKKRFTIEALLALLTKSSLTKRGILNMAKAEGFKAQGANAVLQAALRKKLVKKQGELFLLVKANG
jgi:hypothetical protein